MRAAAGNVALAVEAALVLGLVDHPGVIDGHGIDVTRLRWLHSDNLDVAPAIYNAGEQLGGERITRGMALAARTAARLTGNGATFRGTARSESRRERRRHCMLTTEGA